MSDRKCSHSLTSRFPLPFARFLELHFILYSAQAVQTTFPPFLGDIISVHNVMQRDEINTADVTSQIWVFHDRLLCSFAVKQWRIMFTAFSIEREGVVPKKSYLSLHATGNNYI